MARIWKEKLDPERHRDFMTGAQDAGGIPVAPPKDNLIDRWVYFVETSDITLQFHSTDQIRIATDYFSRKTHPSRRKPSIHLEHYWQRWFERLPAGIHKDSRRKKILKALEQAMDDFDHAAD